MKSFKINPIVNIVRAEIVTDEAEPRVLSFETISSASPEPLVSEGEEEELRVGNTILAQNCLEDIIKGYNITLRDCVLSADLLALTDGGSSVSGEGGAFAGYNGPKAGAKTERTRFDLRIYTAEKDYGGENIAFFRFTYPNCFGTPAKIKFENGAFASPEYVVKSRPGAGENAVKIECMDSLPEYMESAPAVPAQPAAGYCFIATAAFTLGDIAFAAGDTAYYNGSEFVKMQ